MLEHALRPLPRAGGSSPLLSPPTLAWGYCSDRPNAGSRARPGSRSSPSRSGSLIASNRAILVFAAFAINLCAPLPLSDRTPAPRGDRGVPIRHSRAPGGRILGGGVASEPRGSATIATPNAGSRLAAAAFRRHACSPPSIRGHERYGEKLVSVPLRFSRLRRHRLGRHRSQATRCVQMACRTSSMREPCGRCSSRSTAMRREHPPRRPVVLSTGGERVLAGSTAMFMAGALLLALLNLELDRSARRTASAS